MSRSCKIVAYVHSWHGGLCHHPPITYTWHFSRPHPSPTFPPVIPAVASPSGPQCVELPSLCPSVLIVQHPPMSENMWCLIFCSCVSLLRMMISSFIHVPAKDMSSFFMAAQYSIVYMCHNFFIQSIIDGHLGGFQVCQERQYWGKKRKFQCLMFYVNNTKSSSLFC